MASCNNCGHDVSEGEPACLRCGSGTGMIPKYEGEVKPDKVYPAPSPKAKTRSRDDE